MKRIVALTLAAAAFAVPASQANAGQPASPSLRQFKALQKQVKALQAQVKKLQTETTDLENFAGVTIALLVCENVVVTDALQGTWNVIDQIAQTAQAGKVYFGAQTPLVDKNACSAFRITRSQGVPPNVTVFSALVTLLTS
jgi:hypothetical protein